jgi:hypothetical protein
MFNYGNNTIRNLYNVYDKRNMTDVNKTLQLTPWGRPEHMIAYDRQLKVKQNKVHSRTGHEGPEGE